MAALFTLYSAGRAWTDRPALVRPTTCSGIWFGTIYCKLIWELVEKSKHNLNTEMYMKPGKAWPFVVCLLAPHWWSSQLQPPKYTDEAPLPTGFQFRIKEDTYAYFYINYTNYLNKTSIIWQTTTSWLSNSTTTFINSQYVKYIPQIVAALLCFSVFS